jgi:hypothetical protein
MDITAYVLALLLLLITVNRQHVQTKKYQI